MDQPSLNIVTYNDLTFARLSPNKAFEIEDLHSVDGVIIEYTGRQAVLELVSTIRSHDDESIYLLPVFFHKFYREANQNMARFADGTINDLSTLGTVAEVTNDINGRM